jgi:hypothetical protein
MSSLKQTIPHALGTLLAAASLLVAARPSFAFSLSPYVLHPPSLYIIEGYLDRAPQDAKIQDRLEITAHGRRRTLLVTSYGTPGETGFDRYLSRVMAQPFAIEGPSDEVDRLAAAPAGTKIAGTFAAYTGGSPWLLIADLTSPEPRS